MSNQRSYKIISVGDLVADLVISIPKLPVEADQNQIADDIQIEPGGAGNFLIAGARLGMEMTALGAMGKGDSFSTAILKILKSEGVNTKPVVLQGSSTTVLVLVDSSGKHVFLGRYGTGPHIPLSTAWKESIQSADALHGWGYTLKESRLAQTMLDSMALARQHQIPVAFDPGPFMRDSSQDHREAVLQNTSIILLTSEEIPDITGGLDNQAGIDYLLDQGIEIVCVKRGANGCQIHSPKCIAEHPGFNVTARDTTAAGDSFAAAFLFGYLNNWDLSQVALIANAMGAAKVRKIGSGRQVPTLAEVRAVLAQFNCAITV
jgi:sugar/nucleoside kinase (ribokinase family)